jgi:ribosomal protein L29
MKSNINQELKELSVEALELKIDDWRRQLLGLRLSSASSHVKDYSQFKKIRKNIARGLTLLGQKCDCVCDSK